MDIFTIIFCILIGLVTYFIFKPRNEEVVETPTITNFHFLGDSIFVVKSDNSVEKYERTN